VHGVVLQTCTFEQRFSVAKSFNRRGQLGNSYTLLGSYEYNFEILGSYSGEYEDHHCLSDAPPCHTS
jgi:hypothetical protein